MIYQSTYTMPNHSLHISQKVSIKTLKTNFSLRNQNLHISPQFIIKVIGTIKKMMNLKVFDQHSPKYFKGIFITKYVTILIRYFQSTKQSSKDDTAVSFKTLDIYC